MKKLKKNQEKEKKENKLQHVLIDLKKKQDVKNKF